MRILKVFKSGVKIVTVFLPQGALAKVCIGVGTWAVEELVKNTKTTLDDKALAEFKKIVSKEKIIKK